MQHFLVEKLAAAIFESANRGLAQGTAAAVGKIETPLMGLRIVQPHVPFRTIDFERPKGLEWPSQSAGAKVGPSYSAQVVEPLKGCRRRLR